jgi:hypothetical protein
MLTKEVVFDVDMLHMGMQKRVFRKGLVVLSQEIVLGEVS